MLIFDIFKTRKLYKEVKENPGKVVAGQLSGLMFGLVLVPVIVVGVILALLFVLGFTSLILGPFIIAKILFYIFAPLYLIIVFFVWRTMKTIKNQTESFANDSVKKI